MRTRIVKGTMNISSDGDIEFHTFGGDLTFSAGGKNEWTSPQTIVGAYEGGKINEKVLYKDILILRGKRRKGKNMEGKPHLDLMYGDYTEDEKGFEKLWKQIYIENFNHTQNKAFALARANKVVRKISEFCKKTSKKLFEDFKSDIEYYSKGVLEDVAKKMVDTMKTNKSNTYEFSDKRLDIEVNKHSNHINFKNAVINEVKEEIKKFLTIDYAVSNMKITNDGEGILYKKLVDKEIDSPRFPDKMSGLGIMLNDIWAYEIWIKEIKEVIYPWSPNHKYTYLTLNFIYFDHFGLDYPDLEKKRAPSPWIAWYHNIFWEWFVLQHFRGYVPFITKVENSEKILL